MSLFSHRARFLTLLLAPLLLAGLSALVVAQDKKPDDKKDDPPPKAKGQLPANFKQLGLDKSQVEKIYAAQAKYNAEIDKLKAKIDALKVEEKAEIEKVLTADQLKKLKEIRSGEK